MVADNKQKKNDYPQVGAPTYPQFYTRYSRCPGLPVSSLPVCPVYRCFFFVPPRHPILPVVCRYTGVVNFFMLAEPLLLLHTPTHAAAHNTTQHAGCCGQQPTLAYTPCHVRQENHANLVTALPPQNSPAAAHAEVVQADIRAMFSDS